MDTRLKQLSYSSLNLLHACPRKYELYKLQALQNQVDIEDDYTGVTFATGHAIGGGIAECFAGVSERDIIFHMFLGWKPDLLDTDTGRLKSFWLSVIAVQKLISLREDGFLSDWEVVEYNGKPAIELSFIIHLPDSFYYRGFVDAVLRNKIDGRIMVLECKTNSSHTISAAQYKNSAQAIGYSIVLDAIFPNLSTYDVQYLIYRTKHMVYEPMIFTKNYLQRAQWIQDLLLDIEILERYDAANLFPMRGESCRDFNRDCEYFGVCELSNERLTKKLSQQKLDEIEKYNADFQIKITLEDLIRAQLAKE